MLPPESMKFVDCAAVEGHDGDCGPCCVWLGDVWMSVVCVATVVHVASGGHVDVQGSCSHLEPYWCL